MDLQERQLAAFDLGGMTEGDAASFLQTGEAVHGAGNAWSARQVAGPVGSAREEMAPRVSPEQNELVRGIVKEAPDLTVHDIVLEFRDEPVSLPEFVDTGDVMETGSMERRKRRKFTPEFKAEVVGLVRSSGRSVGQIAKELDLTETAVRGWVKRSDIDAMREPQGPPTTEERSELARQRRELKTMTMERDFLRKAAAFFAKSGR